MSSCTRYHYSFFFSYLILSLFIKSYFVFSFTYNAHGFPSLVTSLSTSVKDWLFWLYMDCEGLLERNARSWRPQMEDVHFPLLSEMYASYQRRNSFMWLRISSWLSKSKISFRMQGSSMLSWWTHCVSGERAFMVLRCLSGVDMVKSTISVGLTSDSNLYSLRNFRPSPVFSTKVWKNNYLHHRIQWDNIS